MQRRRFLTTLFGTLVVALPVGKAAAMPVRRRVLIQESPVAGFQYHEGERLWRELREGDALTLARESANTYDPKAVRVDWQGQKLGYVPRVENTTVAQMLDRGERLTARVVRLKQDRDPWERVRFAVELGLGVILDEFLP